MAKFIEIDRVQDLLGRIAQGDSAAFERFYDEHHLRVYAFALSRLRDAADAADILNEVMFEVWRSAGRFEGRSRPLTWVLGIAHHKVIDLLRRRKDTFTGVSDDVSDMDIPDDVPTAEDVMAGVEDAERVRRCIEALSDAHRQVVHLAFYQDLSYTEISELADCPVGTVKTRMLHAKRLLKRCLGGADAVPVRAADGD
ncbi:MAG: sigma-70 family RNA polymerase sigma factor [Nitrospirota bacterium]